MYCPRCRQEFQRTAVRCSDCGVRLVESLEPAQAAADEVHHEAGEQDEFIAVLRTGDESLIRVVCALLESEGIECNALNVRSQDLFGLGRIGGFNLAVGPMEVQVHVRDCDTARELIATLRASGDDPEDE